MGKALNIVGGVLIAIGAILVVASIFGVSQSIGIGTPIGSIESDGLSQLSETMIIAGAVLILFGLLSFYISYKMGK